MFNRMKRLAIGFVVLVAAGSSYAASVVIQGLTFSVADTAGCGVGCPIFGQGSHFHSDPSGSLGRPPGFAEVGRIMQGPGFEEIRGLSEFHLADLIPDPVGTLAFRVANDGGLFSGGIFGNNDFPFDGRIVVESYFGNDRADVFDFEAEAFQPVGSFMTASLAVGDTLTFDVSQFLASSFVRSRPSLGFRLRADPLNSSGAWTFSDFQLVSGIPEPETYALMIAGLGALGFVARRRKRAHQRML